jgi:pantetheine-phosphate adenylyltransferase
MNSKTALIAGSFDPLTLGHQNLIQRASCLFDHLVVGIANNSVKTPTFSFLEKQAMVAACCSSLKNISIVQIDGLVVEYAKHHGVDYLIRGLRSTADFESEMQMANANKKLCGIETLFLLAEPSLAQISSSLIREIAKGGYRLHDFIPSEIEDAVYTRITLKS